MDDEHKNEEFDEYIEPPSEENDIFTSKISEGIIEEYFRNIISSKNISPKVIKAVLFTIDNHEKDLLEVGYENKKNQTQDKWSQLNLMGIQYLLETNHRLPLSIITFRHI